MSYILEMTKYKGPFFFVIVCAILLEGHFTVSLFVLKYLIVLLFRLAVSPRFVAFFTHVETWYHGLKLPGLESGDQDLFLVHYLPMHIAQNLAQWTCCGRVTANGVFFKG